MNRPEYVVAECRRRRPPDPDRREYQSGFGPTRHFISVFFGHGPIEVLPDEVVGDVTDATYEAMREAGMAAMADYCRRLAPAVRAIAEFGR